MSRAGAPHVSVIVVHHEQPRELRRTLRALSGQTHPADRLEVIVVDDGSGRAPDVPPGVRLIRQDRDGARRSAARNRGVAHSTGEILVFLDADTAPEPEFIARLVRLPAHTPDAVVVGRRRHADLREIALDADLRQVAPRHELPAPAWLRDGYRATDDLRRPGPRGFRYVISAVLGCSRSFFDEVGGFDESFAAYGGEDWEWAHRAWLEGATFAHVPDAVAWHDGPDWSGRADAGARRSEKNREALRLAELISAEGHRPHALLGGHPELIATLSGASSPAAAFVCVDSLLRAVPQAIVRVPSPGRADRICDPRVIPIDGSGSAATAGDRAALELELPVPVRFTDHGLAELCAEMLEADLGACRLCDDDGPVANLVSRRHRRRVARSGPAAGRPEIERQVTWARRLPTSPDEPDVEAYLGGWA